MNGVDGGQSQSYANAAATASKDPIAMWTPHDVAEWLYMQARALPCLLDAATPRSPALDKLAA